MLFLGIQQYHSSTVCLVVANSISSSQNQLIGKKEDIETKLTVRVINLSRSALNCSGTFLGTLDYLKI